MRRCTALEAAGVIARNVAVVDADTVNATITAIVEVQLIDERAPTVDRTKVLFSATPEVQQCYYVTGGVSFVRSYRTLVALDRVKADTAIVIP